MATKSAVGKIAQKARKTKQKLAIQMVKKVANVDVKAAKQKGQAKIKPVKKRGR